MGSWSEKKWHVYVLHPVGYNLCVYWITFGTDSELIIVVKFIERSNLRHRYMISLYLKDQKKNDGGLYWSIRRQTKEPSVNIEWKNVLVRFPKEVFWTLSHSDFCLVSDFGSDDWTRVYPLTIVGSLYSRNREKGLDGPILEPSLSCPLTWDKRIGKYVPSNFRSWNSLVSKTLSTTP